MCGIWGLAIPGNIGLNHKDVELLRNMMIAGAVRGVDGTGLFTVNNKGSVNWYKMGGHPFNLLYSEGMSKNLHDLISNGKAIVGHNRWKTIGEVSTKFSHPFQKNHITMVHNGTLHSGIFWPLNGSDSEALCDNIALQGPEVFQKLWGAWAVVWHDKKQNKIFFVRNKERPLSIVKLSNRTIVWASKLKMLEWLVDEAGYTIDKIYEVNPDVCYSLDLDKHNFELMVENTIKVDKPHYKYVPDNKPYTNYMGMSESDYEDVFDGYKTSALPLPKKEERKEEPPPLPVLPAPTPPPAPGNVEPLHGKKFEDKGKGVVFEVLEVEKAKTGNFWTYRGLSSDGEGVWFHTNKDDPSIKGRIYEGKICARSVDKNQGVWYQVKFRELIELSAEAVNERIDKALSPKPGSGTENPLYTGETGVTPRNLVIFADGQAYQRANIIDVLVEDNYNCMSCFNKIDVNDLGECSAVVNTYNFQVPKGIQCPECTASWKTTLSGNKKAS